MDDIQHLQDRYLGLGAEINLAAQLRTQYEDARLNSGDHAIPNVDGKIYEQTHKIIELTRQRDNLRLYLTIKNQLPDEDGWRHPKLPEEMTQGTREERLEEHQVRREEDARKKHEAGIDMKDMVPPKKKSTRKGAAIKSKTVKVKKS